MNRDEEFNIMMERVWKLTEAYKGFTTRLRLMEASVEKLEEKERKRL
jgi:hypothetical protein